MAKLLKLRRGTTSQHGSFTGAEGEVTVDTDKETLVVHDGSTAGGHPVAAEDMANVSSASIAGRLSNDSIATSKIAAGALPSDVTVASANLVDGTIVNADVNASAAIAGTKISPDFGSQNITTTGDLNCSDITLSDAHPVILFTDTDNDPDFRIKGNSGSIEFEDVTNNRASLTIYNDNHVDVHGNLDVGAGIDVTGNITVSGTVDGRDVASDGSKLDGIESGATADQTGAEIRTLVESASDSNVFTDADHTKLNGIETAATADQTAAEIRTLVGSASDSNVFTDADHAKLDALTTSNGALVNGVTATTQSASDNSTKIATTAYTDTAVSNLVDSSPGALNTLNELAAAINDDASFSTTVTNSIATKMPLGGGEFTGDVTCEHIVPDGDSSRNLGSNSVRFANVYADNFVGGGGNLTGITSFVSGMIIMYNSTTAPSGWYLCDGNNGTPDLRDRFIVGAGNSYSQGATGGSNTATSTVSISVSVSGTTGTPANHSGNAFGYGNLSSASHANQNHNHNFSGSGSGSDTVSIDTRSPYYALTFIMKA